MERRESDGAKDEVNSCRPQQIELNAAQSFV